MPATCVDTEHLPVIPPCRNWPLIYKKKDWKLNINFCIILKTCIFCCEPLPVANLKELIKVLELFPVDPAYESFASAITLTTVYVYIRKDLWIWFYSNAVSLVFINQPVKFPDFIHVAFSTDVWPVCMQWKPLITLAPLDNNTGVQLLGRYL